MTTSGRRLIDHAAGRNFQVTMRNDFLTPRGTPYKWQELTASVERTVIGGGAATVVPVRYRWHQVDARTGTPKAAQERREWTFARGQSFTSLLLHAELAGAAQGWSEPLPTALDIRYPELPKSPAVDLLLMLSWDVVTFELICTHLTTTPELSEVGGCAELERLAGTWADLQFSVPAAVATFTNARPTARHLGNGQFAGRPSDVYSSYCLDCALDVRSGPVSQRGRSSCWITLQADTQTADLLSAEMTEIIIATLTSSDGQRIPVCKRRIVRMWVGTNEPPSEPARSFQQTAGVVDAAALAETTRLAGRVADYLKWQVSSLEKLPAGMADLALMGFRSVVGTDMAGAHRQVRSLQAALRAAAGSAGEASAGEAQADLWQALPDHRRRLEGLLAFGQLAVDGANQGLIPDDANRKATQAHMNAVSADLSSLLAMLDRLERPIRPNLSAPAAPDTHPEETP